MLTKEDKKDVIRIVDEVLTKRKVLTERNFDDCLKRSLPFRRLVVLQEQANHMLKTMSEAINQSLNQKKMVLDHDERIGDLEIEVDETRKVVAGHSRQLKRLSPNK